MEVVLIGQLVWWLALSAAAEPPRLHTIGLIYCHAALCLMMEMYLTGLLIQPT